MRFGRRNKSGTIWGRLKDAESEASASARAPESAPNEGDPAQSLLNYLGRFQRHYLRGKDGAHQREWSDDCMNALIDAVDIAVAQRWNQVVTSLTETARILQTYEDADRANECVPFLASSHEVLCHMVGDLLTGEIRPGLVRKWESMHARALADVQNAGLSLVQDELSDEELEQSAFPEEESPFDEAPEEAMVAASNEDEAEMESDDDSPFELPDFAKASESSEPSSADPFDNMPELPDLAEAGPAAEAEPEPEPESEPEPELFAEEPEAEEAEDDRIVSFPSRAESEPQSVFEDAPALDEMESAQEEAGSMPELDLGEAVAEADPEPDETEVVTGILDTACEALANVTENLTTFQSQIQELEARAEEAEWPGATAACRSILRLLEMLEARNIEPTDRFVELGYAFSGVYVESRESVETDEYKAFQKDVVALLQDWMDDRREDDEAVTEAAADILPEPDSDTDDPALVELLDTLRSAMKGGSPANAKLVMLEAAARIAREQEAEAEAKVAEAEQTLNANSAELEATRNGVQEQEHRVNESAAKVTDAQRERETQRTHITQVAERLDEMQGRVDAINEQIRELEARRAEAEAERAGVEEALREAEAAEADNESQLNAAREAERDARLQLEEERRRAKSVQNSRGDLERAVIAQRELLAKQRQSTADIEQTIAHIRDSETGEASPGNESLF